MAKICLPPLSDYTVQKADSTAGSSADTVTRLYEVTLITAMMGGGVSKGQADADKPFRADSIKGQWRHWWRVLARAGCFDGANSSLSALDANGLRSLESALWGNLEAQGPKKSRIGLAIRSCNAAAPVVLSQFQQLCFDSERVLNPLKSDLMTAYFPAEASDNRGLCSFTLPGGGFTMEAKFPKAHQAELELVISVWATLGGLGARTRRGAGAVEVFCVEGAQRHLLNALVDHPKALGLGFKCCVRPVNFAANVATALQAATAQGPVQLQPLMAHIDALGRMRRFRQGKADSGPGGPLVVRSGTHPGRSAWPEPDMIRRTTGLAYTNIPARTARNDRQLAAARRDHTPVHSAGNFAPRAAFGMPLLIKFHDQQIHSSMVTGWRQPTHLDVAHFDPATRTLTPNLHNVDRMASPVILRPVAFARNGGIQYKAVAALILQHPFRQVQSVKVASQDPASAAIQTPVWNPAWNRPAATAAPVPIAALALPIAHGAPCPQVTSAVDAFMNYFAQQP